MKFSVVQSVAVQGHLQDHCLLYLQILSKIRTFLSKYFCYLCWLDFTHYADKQVSLSVLHIWTLITFNLYCEAHKILVEKLSEYVSNYSDKIQDNISETNLHSYLVKNSSNITFSWKISCFWFGRLASDCISVDLFFVEKIVSLWDL